MTKQQVFNKVWNHYMVSGGRMAKTSNGDSYYKLLNRIEEERIASCPVGLFLGDEYESSMEGFGVILLFKMHPELQKLFKGVDVFFLAKLQEAHDIAANITEFDDELRGIAEAYELVVPKAELV